MVKVMSEFATTLLKLLDGLLFLFSIPFAAFVQEMGLSFSLCFSSFMYFLLSDTVLLLKFFRIKLNRGTGGGFPEWGGPFALGFEGGTCSLHCPSLRS